MGRCERTASIRPVYTERVRLSEKRDLSRQLPKPRARALNKSARTLPAYKAAIVLPTPANALCIAENASARTRLSRLSRSLPNSPWVSVISCPFSSLIVPNFKSTLSSIEKAPSRLSSAGETIAISCSSRADSTWARLRIMSSTICLKSASASSAFTHSRSISGFIDVNSGVIKDVDSCILNNTPRVLSCIA